MLLIPYGRGSIHQTRRNLFGEGRNCTSRYCVRVRTMTTLAEALCRPELVHLVGAFVPSCPSLLVKSTTLAEAFQCVKSRQRCLRTDEQHHQAKLFSFLVKLMLSRWRNIAIYPKRYARAMLQADLEQKRTLTRLKCRLKPCFLASPFSDGSTTTGGGVAAVELVCYSGSHERAHLHSLRQP